MKPFRIFLIVLIALGILLRFVDITIPDLATDEAQAALGASAAWTPLGIMILSCAQALFGHTILVVRLVSVLFGILSLVLIFRIAREFFEEETALLAVSIAALFPSHIIFSRLAYLSVQECFWWLLVLLAFLQARKSQKLFWYCVIFFAIIASTMTKTQDILFPAMLILRRIIELRGKVLRDTLTWVIAIACIPFAFYVATSPGIFATLFLYGGTMYGVSGGLMRVTNLLSTWWSVLGIFLIAMALSLPELRKLPWPFHALLAVAVLTGFLLGPGHEYYTTSLVIFAMPIAMIINSFSTRSAALRLRSLEKNMPLACLLPLFLWTLLTLGPAHLVPYPRPLFAEEGFWNQFADDINEVLKGEEAVTVLGDAGHHLRWYLEPRVLVGKDMIPPYPTQYVILLGLDEAPKVPGAKLVWASEGVGVVRQAK